jgi:hypothetical protein
MEIRAYVEGDTGRFRAGSVELKDFYPLIPLIMISVRSTTQLIVQK